MPYSNLLLQLDDDFKNQIIQDIQQVKQKIQLVSLTGKEKKQQLKLGSKTESFLVKATLLAKTNSNVLPPYFTLDDFTTKVNDWVKLREILMQVKSYYEGLSSTVIALEQESMSMALAFYQQSKIAATQQVPGAKKIMEALEPMMPKKGKGMKKKLPLAVGNNKR